MEIFILVSVILLWLVVLLNLVLTLALIRRVNTDSQYQRGSALATGLTTGIQAPNFTAMTLDEERITLADYIGRPTTFVFASPHCATCRALLPTLKHLAPQARRSGAELVLVSGGALEETKVMVAELERLLPVLVAPRAENTFFTDYKLHATPFYCSLDEQGTVVAAGRPDQFSPEWQKLTADWGRQASLAERR